MSWKHTTSVIIAIIAAVASIVAAAISYNSSIEVQILQERYAQARESVEFIDAQIHDFYQPITMNLIVTKGLFDRLRVTKKEEEKEAIEQLMRNHNKQITEILMTKSKYLEPDAPDAVSVDLLVHLFQWEIVYQLKYDYEIWNQTVFAGIEDFGFRRFPQDVEGYESVDDYYTSTTERLKKKLYDRMLSPIQDW